MTVDGVAGEWPAAFPVLGEKAVTEGVVVRSLSGEIEGWTTGSRRRASPSGARVGSSGCGWETGQLMRICSEGWAFDPASGTVSVTGGGEISARFVAPKPLGTPPLPRSEWPTRAELQRFAGWRAARPDRASGGRA